MEDKNYEVLGVSPDATTDEIKKRYNLLMRRSIHDASFDIDSITEAYDRIMSGDMAEKANVDILKGKGPKKKKIRNFMSHFTGKTN